MKVLMIGFDHTMLAECTSKSGDTKERHIKYAKALRQYYPSGHICVILKVPPSWSSRPRELNEGLVVYPLPCRRLEFPLKALRTLRRIAEKERFDVVTTQTPFDDGFVGVWMKRNFGISLNVQMRSSFLDMPYWIRERPIIYRAFNLLGKWVAHRADTIRVVSYGEKQRLEQKFPRLNGKIVCLHPLVNTQIFGQPITDDELGQVQAMLKQQQLDGVPLILFVGRLSIEKNLLTLLRAFALVNMGMHVGALVIAGDGPLKPKLSQVAKRLGIEDRIVWLRNLPLRSLRGWYAAARTTVLPSFHEGLPKVIVESYLMGTPAVVTPFVSAPELVQDGKTGFITSSFTDPEELADKMVSLLSSPELAKNMGEMGRQHVLSYLLSEDLYMQRLIQIWEQTALKGRVANVNKEDS